MSAPTVRFDVTVEMIGEHGSPLQRIHNYNLIKLFIKRPQRKESHIAVRLFARGLDKEMGMSGTDAFTSSGK